jgi:hypothetical protein
MFTRIEPENRLYDENNPERYVTPAWACKTEAEHERETLRTGRELPKVDRT